MWDKDDDGIAKGRDGKASQHTHQRIPEQKKAIYIYIYIYIYTRTHTHTHTYCSLAFLLRNYLIYIHIDSLLRNSLIYISIEKER